MVTEVVQESDAGRPAAWTRGGALPLQRRLERFAARLPRELQERLELVLTDLTLAFDAASGEASAPGEVTSPPLPSVDDPATRRRRYDATRALERLAYEVECCPLPEVGWQRPGWLLSVKLVETVRIRFALRQPIIERCFSRVDAVGRETERRCDWFWQRCSALSGPPPDTAPARGNTPADWDTYELIREDPT